MKRLAKFPVSKILTGKISHKRLKVFKKKGVTCAKCGIKGKFVALEKDNNGSLCFNLYAIDENKGEVLIIVDHIVPKSKGGTNKLDNLQTMCLECNNGKDDN